MVMANAIPVFIEPRTELSTFSTKLFENNLLLRVGNSFVAFYRFFPSSLTVFYRSRQLKSSRERTTVLFSIGAENKKANFSVFP